MMHGYGRRPQAAVALGDEDEQYTMLHSAAYGGIFHVEEEEEQRERVVYEELDDSARRTKELLAASERRLLAEKKRRQTEKQQILERPKELFAQHAVFAGALSGEDDGGESGDEDEANPFASLLNAAPVKAKKRHEPSPMKASRRPPSPSFPTPPSPEPSRRSPPKRVTPPLHSARSSRASLPASTIVQQKSNRRSSAPTAGGSFNRSLGPTFEAADARPARWARNVPTASATNKRRQSASTAAALAKQQAEAKRRKSLPASLSSLETDRQPVGRRLADVLQKATVLSQQRSESGTASAMRDQSFEYTEPTRETDDGIADTVREMRDEPFQTQFFSPSKLRQGSSTNRRPRADAVLAKIRGSIGDAIRKATRKTNRDLTLLRSQGQTLLRHGDQDSAGEVHGREFVIVRLGKSASHPQLITYEAVMEESSPHDSESQAGNSATAQRGLKLTVLFSTQDGAALTQQLAREVRVKIFAPFQIISECFVPGLRRKKRQFLVGTSLFEILSGVQSTQ